MDSILNIGRFIRKTRDITTYSSLCRATRALHWTGEVVVTERWIDQFPPPRSNGITSLTFKRYGRFDVEAFQNFTTLERLRYQCCRVPYMQLLEVIDTMSSTLRHLHVHCLDPGSEPFPSVMPLLKLPSLETLDITLAMPEAWGVVPIVTQDLSRSLKTLKLRGARYIWCEDEGEGVWPETLHCLDLEATGGILTHVLPTTLHTLTLDSQRGRIDDEDIFGVAQQYPHLHTVSIKTRGAFGFPWLRRTPELQKLHIQSDTVILDASLGVPKKLEFLVLECLAYFAMAFLSFTVLERLRGIAHTEFRSNGGKLIDVEAFI